MDKKKPLTIQELYPDYTPEEQQESAYTLMQYGHLVRRIYERLKREGKLEEALAEIRKERDKRRH